MSDLTTIVILFLVIIYIIGFILIGYYYYNQTPCVKDFCPEEEPFKSCLLKGRIKRKLIDLLKRFDSVCESDYFICYGTLLGQVRHGGIIPWDDDIDVGIYDEKKFLSSDFASVGLRIEKCFFGWKVFDAKKSYPFIDVFLYNPKTGLLNEKSQKVFGEYKGFHKRNSCFPLRRVSFGGIEVYAPKCSEKILNAIYPNWKTKAIIQPNHRGKGKKFSLKLNDRILHKISQYQAE